MCESGEGWGTWEIFGCCSDLKVVSVSSAKEIGGWEVFEGIFFVDFREAESGLILEM